MGKAEIDKALGLGEGGIDKFLTDLEVESPEKLKEGFDSIDKNVKAEVAKIDDQMKSYSIGGLESLSISSIESSLCEIKSLIDESKAILKHTYENICTNDLIDPEVLGSYAKLMEATHLTLSEYVQLFRDRLNFYDKVRIEKMKHEQKKELMQMKIDFEQQKFSAKHKDAPIDGQMVFDTDNIIDVIDRHDKGKLN